MARQKPAPSPTASITGLLETGTVDSLLEAWQRVPATELAEALESVPVAGLDEVVTGNAIEGLARLSRLDARPDPRTAGIYVRWLADPPWHATGSKPFYTQVFKRLVATADPRGIAALPKASKAMQKTVKGKTMRGWLVEKIDETVGAIRAARPGGVPALSARDARLVATAAKSLASKPVSKKASKLSSAAAELLAAIRADPTDDGARQVYADVLTEKGDPRGEFITMQLARNGKVPTAAEAKREIDLLFKHQRLWLAELAGVVGDLSKYNLTVGPERDGRLRFERGFLAGCSITGSRAKIAAIANHPDLATIENLDLMDHANTLLDTAELPALDELQLYARYLPSVIKRPFKSQLRTLALWDRDRGPAFVTDIESCAELPALRTLSIYPRADILDEPTANVVRAGLALPQLETLHAELSHGGATFRRKGTRWTIELQSGTPKGIATALRKLI